MVGMPAEHSLDIYRTNSLMVNIQFQMVFFMQAWVQIHEYLYLVIFKYFSFEYLYSYFGILKQKVFVFQILLKVFELLYSPLNNTFKY